MSRTRPELTVATRRGRAELRAAGGLRGAVRVIRTTAGEYGDVVGPWQAAIEVAAPPFWAWTATAAMAAAVEVLLVPVAALAAALG